MQEKEYILHTSQPIDGSVIFDDEFKLLAYKNNNFVGNGNLKINDNKSRYIFIDIYPTFKVPFGNTNIYYDFINTFYNKCKIFPYICWIYNTDVTKKLFPSLDENCYIDIHRLCEQIEYVISNIYFKSLHINFIFFGKYKEYSYFQTIISPIVKGYNKSLSFIDVHHISHFLEEKNYINSSDFIADVTKVQKKG